MCFFRKIYFLILFLVIHSAAADKKIAKEKASPKKTKLQITLEVKDYKKVKDCIIVKIKNTSNETLFLDEEALQAREMLKLSKKGGQLVVYGAPLINPSLKDKVRKISPNETIIVKTSFPFLTPAELGNPPYRLQACYFCYFYIPKKNDNLYGENVKSNIVEIDYPIVYPAGSRKDIKPEKTKIKISLELKNYKKVKDCIIVKIKNTSEEELYLDNNVLQITPLLRFRKNDGAQVPRNLPPLPLPPEKRLLKIKPNELIIQKYSIQHLTVQILKNPPYHLQVSYSPSFYGLKPNKKFYKEEVYSNVVVFDYPVVYPDSMRYPINWPKKDTPPKKTTPKKDSAMKIPALKVKFPEAFQKVRVTVSYKEITLDSFIAFLNKELLKNKSSLTIKLNIPEEKKKFLFKDVILEDAVIVSLIPFLCYKCELECKLVKNQILLTPAPKIRAK